MPDNGGPGWRVLCWNAGGLTASTWQELETYARLYQYDAVLVQETKWRHDSTWSNQAFHYVHSQGVRKEDSTGGVLIMIATRHAKARDIQFHAIHPGRLVHVRIPKGQTHIDIMNLYQYSVSDAEGVYERRAALTFKLHRCLAGLPRRNFLLLGGDFNCPCEPHKATCGQCVLNHNLSHYRDYQDMQNVLRTLHLCVLNTWCRPQHGQLATFTFGKIASQIDFLVVRQQHADARAKKAQILDRFPVGAWREGANHHPVVATITLPKHVYRASPSAGVVPQFDQESLARDLRASHTPEALTALRHAVASTIQGVQNAHACMLQAAAAHYPVPEKVQRRPDQPEDLANSAKHMWGMFRQMRQQRRTMQGIVTAWRIWQQFQQAHRIHKHRSRQRLKQRRDDLIQQAHDSAVTGNLFGLWRVVKQLAPKAPRKRLQLHRDNRIISTEEELQWILDSYGERYGADASIEPPDITHCSTQQVSISPTELIHVLLHLSPRKAVPRGCAPTVLLKACGMQIAEAVASDVNHQWTQPAPQVAQGWSDAEVVLLPKAHGRSQTPLDYRPIGLQDPLGKSIMTLLIQQVFQHCHRIREISKNERLTLHQRAEGLQQWHHLKQALDLAGTPLHVQELLLKWLIQEWVQDHAVLYAAKTAFRVLQSFHLKINFEKTKAILKVVGTQQDKDQTSRLLLSPKDPTTWITLVTQTEWAMAKILHSRKMGIHYKLWVWRSCVLSTMTYGLQSCGITGDHAQEAQRSMMKHVRAIVSNQAHITGDTHAAIMEQYHIKPFRVLIQEAHERELQTAIARQDWMWDSSWQQHVQTQLAHRMEQPTHSDEAEVWSCPHCEEVFVSSAALKTHARRTHGIKEEHQHIFNKAEHSIGGLPTCRCCGKKFSKWQSLAMHINQNSCPVLTRDAESQDNTEHYDNMPDPNSVADVMCRQPEVVQASKKGINAFITLHEYTQRMRQTITRRSYSMDDALSEFFGEVKSEQEGKANKRRRPEEGPQRRTSRSHNSQSEDSLLVSLARLTLRQEEELLVLKQDHSLILFMRPGKDSVLNFLFQTASLYKQKMKETPTWGVNFQPPRAVLALALFKELANRLETTLGDSAKLKEIKDLGWMDEQGRWKYQVWNASLRHLQEDTDRKPLTTEEIKVILNRLYGLLKGDVVTRFHCTRKLTETMEGQATFFLDLSSRGSGQEAWQHLQLLQGSCVLQLIGLAYKK
ncbi:unnamed protein product, partial [Symbiodinium sp. CCMP2456]